MGWDTKKYVSLIEKSPRLSSNKQPQEQQSKTSDKPHGSRDGILGQLEDSGANSPALGHSLHRGSEKGVGVGWGGGLVMGPMVVVGGYKPWPSHAVAPFTVLVNSQINGDTVMRASEGSCIVVVEWFTQACLSYQTGLCREHLFLIFHDCGGPLRSCIQRFLFKFEEHKESHSDMLYKRSGE